MNVEAVGKQALELISLYSLRLLAAIAILVVGRWLAGMAARLAENALAKRLHDLTIRQFLSKLVFALVMVFAVVAALSNVGIQTASIVAALGAAGLAIGLALQGSLSNFAAGVLMVMFRPCRVGDYIEAGVCVGTVKNISLFFTTLITADNRQIVAPNSVIMAVPITNYSALPLRRLELKININYGADRRRAQAELGALLARDARILDNPAPAIAVLELGPGAVTFALRAWVNSTDLAAVYADLPEAIKLHLDQLGIPFSYPQQPALQAPASAR